MPSGFKYVKAPEMTPEERYDVKSGVRRRGAYVLQTDHLPVGTRVPSFAPIYADKQTKKCWLVSNAALYEAADATATAYKLTKGSGLYAGAFLGTGKKGATITAVDTGNALYDLVTVDATLGVALNKGDIVFEASAAGGTKQKYVANSALYETKLIEDGINLVALLRTAAEIEPDKLAIPYTDADKAALQGWFDFND